MGAWFEYHQTIFGEFPYGFPDRCAGYTEFLCQLLFRYGHSTLDLSRQDLSFEQIVYLVGQTALNDYLGHFHPL